MSLPAFAVTWDYRCPFARNAHEHLIEALRAGAGWEVTFTPFSLSQVHVPEGGNPVWEDPEARPDLIALEAGLVVRDRRPEDFLRAHRALFAARHDEGGDLRDEAVVRRALESAEVPSDEVLAEVAEGWPLEQLRKEHEAAANDYSVFGVPTFIVGAHAAFARIMDRPQGDPDLARTTIERIVRLVSEHPELNELKHTTLDR